MFLDHYTPLEHNEFWIQRIPDVTFLGKFFKSQKSHLFQFLGYQELIQNHLKLKGPIFIRYCETLFFVGAFVEKADYSRDFFSRPTN